MPVGDPVTVTVWEGNDAVIMARVRFIDAELITIAAVNTIVRKTFDPQSNTPDVPLKTDSLVVADSVFDTLQTTALDARWTDDAEGYNFRDTIPGATHLLDGDKSYRIEYLVTPTSGNPFTIVAKVDTKNIRTS